MGTSVTASDKVSVEGRLVKPTEQFVYYVLNKPKGIITTSADEQGRKTVIDLVPKNPRVVACGRLDAPSRGLVLLTNDGDLCYKLTHPKYQHEKEYTVLTTINNGPTLEERIEKLARGVVLEDGMTAPAKVTDVKRSGMRLSFTIVLHEGKNHQVRRMCSAVGLDVIDLCRTRIGKLELGSTPEGRWRMVKKEEIV
jgi:23S rRNA pseudouridine2605 synthase